MDHPLPVSPLGILSGVSTVDLTTMSEDEAILLAARLVGQLGESREEVDRAQRRAVGIRKMIDALVEMFPAVEDVLPDDLDPDEVRPRGAEAVYRVLADRMGKWWRVESIVEFLEEEEWLPDSANPAKAVRSALERGVTAGDLEKGRSKDGGLVIYRVPPPKPPTPPKAGPGGGFDEEPF